MPEKCQFCHEIAVIQDVVEGGGEELICMECGSLATELISKDCNIYDSDFDEEVNVQPSNSSDDLDICCESCGIALDDSENQTICSTCLTENVNETKEVNDIASKIKCNDESDEIVQKCGQEIKCFSCKSSNLSCESVSGDERMICLDCGCVNSNVVLTSDPTSQLTQTDGNHMTTMPNFYHHKKQKLEGMMAGLEKIKELCSKYCFHIDMKKEAVDMFKNLFYHPKVLHVKVTTKQNIGAACLFIVCRQSNYPICLTLFREDVHVFKSYLKAVRHVMTILEIKLPHLSITNQLTTFLIDTGIGGEMRTKVKDILFLCRKAWLTQGRSRPGLITIAAYYAYVSSRCNKFITLRKFCDLYKIHYASKGLAKECEVFLLKLAESLPWVSQGKICVKHLHLYINDIIKYQESLFHFVFKSEEDGIQEQNGDSHKPKVEVEDIKQIGVKRKEILMPSSAKKKWAYHCESKVDIKPVPHGINLNNPELQENEFEEEIDSYILTSEELAAMRDHKVGLWKE